MRNLNWAILGLGTIATSFSEALMNVNNEIYAVASRSQKKAEEFASKFNVKKIYGSYDEMLNDENVDVVYIATPHCNHYEYIMKSLKNNKHVLCEKAITVNANELNEVISLAKEKNLVVCEAMTIYHMPLYKKLSDIISTGKLGVVKMIQASFGSCKEIDINNRFFNPTLAGGALLDIGTYALSFTRFFLSSMPTEILTTVKPFSTGVDEQSGILLKNKDNEMAVISLTMRAKMPKRGIVALEEGFITIEDYPRATKATITHTATGKVEIIEAGDSSKALEYEVIDMTTYIERMENDTLNLSIDVMNIMHDVRNQWGIKYPFE